MSKIIWIAIIYLLIITSTTGELNVTNLKSENGLKTEGLSLLKINTETNFASIYKIVDSKSVNLFHDKIMWGKNREKLKFNREVRNLKYLVDNKYVGEIHNRNKRDFEDWFGKYQEEQRQKSEQLEQQRKEEEEKQRQKVLQENKERHAKETITIFVLVGILIIIGIVICVICKQVTHKFEGNNNEIQNFVMENNHLSERTQCINEVNGQVQVSNAERCCANNDDDYGEEDAVLNYSQSYTNSALNSGFIVPIAHSNNSDGYDLPPTYDEAVANTVNVRIT